MAARISAEKEKSRMYTVRPCSGASRPQFAHRHGPGPRIRPVRHSKARPPRPRQSRRGSHGRGTEPAQRGSSLLGATSSCRGRMDLLIAPIVACASAPRVPKPPSTLQPVFNFDSSLRLMDGRGAMIWFVIPTPSPCPSPCTSSGKTTTWWPVQACGLAGAPHGAGRGRNPLCDADPARPAGPTRLPVHRLDKGTCGVLVMALHSDAARALSQSFENQATHKVYIAMVRGWAPRPWR